MFNKSDCRNIQKTIGIEIWNNHVQHLVSNLASQPTLPSDSDLKQFKERILFLTKLQSLLERSIEEMSQ